MSTDYQKLYTSKCEELNKLLNDYNEYREIMDPTCDELNFLLEQQKNENQNLQKQNEKLQEKLEKMQQNKNKEQQTLVQLERELANSKSQAKTLSDELARTKVRVVDLENQLEEAFNRSRADEQSKFELQQKIENLMEQSAMDQTEICIAQQNLFEETARLIQELREKDEEIYALQMKNNNLGNTSQPNTQRTYGLDTCETFRTASPDCMLLTPLAGLKTYKKGFFDSIDSYTQNTISDRRLECSASDQCENVLLPPINCQQAIQLINSIISRLDYTTDEYCDESLSDQLQEDD